MKKTPKHNLVAAIATLQFTLLALAIAPASQACAPTPCIEASPNPVSVGSNSILGSTLLDWDAGGMLNVRVTVEVDGQETVLSNAAQGTESRGISRGKVYLFKLIDSTTVLDSVEVTTTSSLRVGRRKIVAADSRPVSPAPIRVTFDQFGTFARFQMGTSEDRNFLALVATNETPGCEVAGLDVVDTQVSNEYLKQHSTVFFGLEPSTDYFFLIQMRTEEGDLRCRTGFFRTLKRHTTVYLEDFFITDDSDDLSGADLTLGAFLNPNYDPGIGEDPADVWVELPKDRAKLVIDTGTGYSFDPDASLTIDDVASADFNVTMYDDDSYEGPFALSRCGTGRDPRQGGGTEECWDWGGVTIPLDFRPAGPGNEEVTRSFELVQSEGPLTFRANGRFTVTYRPDW